MRITILAGGQSPERSVSLVTGRAVKSALEDLGHTVHWIDPGPDLPMRLWQERQAGCDFVWIALHGAGGEDGTVQAMLDWVGIPYQGSSYLPSALAMDKAVSKRLFESAGVPTPAWRFCTADQAPDWAECQQQLGSPVVVKPVDCGSTVGITIAPTESAFLEGIALARSFCPRLILERYIAGKELTVSILDGQILPAIEIIPANADQFYDFEAKYAPGGSRHLIPCSLSAAGLARAEVVALQAYRALGCAGLARVDLRIDTQEDPWVLEVNTLPGMTPTSLCPDAAAAVGWSFANLVDRCLQAGLERRIPARILDLGLIPSDR